MMVIVKLNIRNHFFDSSSVAGAGKDPAPDDTYSGG